MTQRRARPTQRASVSRHLAYVLRHDPASIGLHLEVGGWVRITDLLRALGDHGRPLTHARLVELVETDTKGRYTMREGRIRAAQGHSVEVDLDLVPAPPPARLFHGTVARALPGIRELGLRPGSRRHVHLSCDRRGATAVGARRGVPVVLDVDAAGAHAAGVVFFRSENGVWLTDALPPQHLLFPETE